MLCLPFYSECLTEIPNNLVFPVLDALVFAATEYQANILMEIFIIAEKTLTIKSNYFRSQLVMLKARITFTFMSLNFICQPLTICLVL